MKGSFNHMRDRGFGFLAHLSNITLEIMFIHQARSVSTFEHALHREERAIYHTLSAIMMIDRFIQVRILYLLSQLCGAIPLYYS